MRRSRYLKEVCPTCEEYNGQRFTGCSESNIKNLIKEIMDGRAKNYCQTKCKYFRISFEGVMKKIIREEDNENTLL